MTKILCISVFLYACALGCNSDKASSDPAGAQTAAPTGASPASTAAAGADAPCEAVVAKLASYDPSAGEPEKKLWSKMCPAMPPAMRACIVASKTKEERDACDKGQKP